MIETGLYTYLAALPEVTAVVADRIYPAPLPAEITFPAITYSRDGSSETSNFDEGQADLVIADLQIDAWAANYEDAIALAVIIRRKLKNFTGDMGGVTVRACRKQGEVDIYENEVSGYRRSQSFQIWYIED